MIDIIINILLLFRHGSVVALEPCISGVDIVRDECKQHEIGRGRHPTRIHFSAKLPHRNVSRKIPIVNLKGLQNYKNLQR